MSSDRSPLYFRRAHASEAPALCAIARESKSHWPYSAAQLAAWQDDLTVRPHTISSLPTHVAEMGGRIVAFFVLLPGPQEWTLEHFWVSPSAMGQGVGRTLLSHAASVAAVAGATGLAIDADPHAEGFYRSCGAERVGSIPAPIEGAPNRQRPQLRLFIEPHKPCNA